MYVNEDYINDYKYLVGVSDNYVTLTDVSHVSDNDINVLYQYISPSPLAIEGTLYVSGDQYYDNISSQLSSEYWERGDLPQVMIAQFILLVLFGWLLNQLTKLVHKGGIFGA